MLEVTFTSQHSRTVTGSGRNGKEADVGAAVTDATSVCFGLPFREPMNLLYGALLLFQS